MRRSSLFVLPLGLVVQVAAWAQVSRVTVEVVDPSGERVERAAVELEPIGAGGTRQARTGAQGAAAFEVEAGSYSLVVDADGFEPYLREVAVASGAPLRVTAKLVIEVVSTTVQVVESPVGLVAASQAESLEIRSTRPVDLAEKLKEIPGVLGVRRGATNLDPVIQGLRESQLAMVVDGTRTFAAGPARMDSELSHVASGFVGAVEVVKGPYALTEGSGAMSAVLVETEPVPYYRDWTFGGITAAGYSFNDTGRFAKATLFGANRRFGFRLRGVGDKGNNYSAGERGAIRTSIPGRHSHHQFGGKFRFNFTDSHEVLFDGGYDEQTNVDYPGRLLDAAHFITRAWNGAYYIKQPSPLVRSMKFGLYLNKKSHRMRNDAKPTARDMPGRVPPFGLDVSLPTESDTWGGSGAFTFTPAPTWLLRTGFDFYNLDQDATRFISRRRDGRLLFTDNVWPDASLNNQGLYVQTAKQFEKGEISAALRFDFLQANANRASQFFLDNTTGNVSQDEFNTSFSIAARRSLRDGITLAGGFGRAVRSASALERYSDRFPSTKFQVAAEFLGTPSANPESSWQGDVALEFNFSGVTFHGGAFYRRIDDYLTVAPAPEIPKRLPLSPPLVFRYVSGNHANFRGLDFGIRWKVGGGFELRSQGAYTLADDIEESIPAIARNEPVIGIAPFEVRSTLRYAMFSDRLWGEFGMRNVWSQDRVARSRLETPSPGFTTFDLRFGTDVPGGLTLLIVAENLADKHYFEHLNSLNPFTRERIPERGRNVHIGLSRSW